MALVFLAYEDTPMSVFTDVSTHVFDISYENIHVTLNAEGMIRVKETSLFLGTRPPLGHSIQQPRTSSRPPSSMASRPLALVSSHLPPHFPPGGPTCQNPSVMTPNHLK